MDIVLSRYYSTKQDLQDLSNTLQFINETNIYTSTEK